MIKILNEYEAQIAEERDTKEKIKRLNKLSEDLERKKPLHSLTLSELALQLSEKENFKEGIIKSLIQIGRSLWITGKLEAALENLIEGLSIAREVNHQEYEVELLNALGNVNLYLKIYDRALEYYRQALNLATAIHYEALIAGILNNLGELHFRLQDYDAALPFYQDSLKKFKQATNNYQITVPLLNIGGVHVALKNYVEAKKQLLLCLQVCEDNNDLLRASRCYHLLGKMSFEKRHFDETIKYFNKCLNINRDIGDVFLQIRLSIDYFHLLSEMGKVNKGLEYLLEALNLAENINEVDYICQCCSHLAKTYDQLGDFDQSLKYYKKFHSHTNEIARAEQESKLRGIAIQIKAEESQRKNKAFEIINAKLEEKTNQLYRSYSQMKIICEIGQSITSTLSIRDVFQRIFININKLVDASVLGIGLYNEKKDVIDYKFYIEDGVHALPFEVPMSSHSSIGVWCFKNKQAILINDIESEYMDFVDEIQTTSKQLKSSLIYHPLYLNEEIIGVVTIQSLNKNAYTQYDVRSLQALASFIVIALNNAEKSEKLEKEILIRKQSQRELVELNKKLVKISEIDSLTEIPNRRRFDILYASEWKRAVRDQLPLSIIIIDVDQFKEYNDHYGHQQGDRILCSVAKVLKSVPKRQSDFVARYGGDEFVAVLPNTDEFGAAKVANSMLRKVVAMQMQHDYSKAANFVTLTIGTATIIPKVEMDREELLKNADNALYLAKHKGRNCVVQFRQDAKRDHP